MAGDAAAAAAATASIGRSPIDRKAFGTSAPSRLPAPAARMTATACVSASMRAAWQTRLRAVSGLRRGGRGRLEGREDHASGGRLDDVADTCADLRSDRLGRFLDDHHRAVVEIADRLTG